MFQRCMERGKFDVKKERKNTCNLRVWDTRSRSCIGLRTRGRSYVTAPDGASFIVRVDLEPCTRRIDRSS